jgi:hypothetical protein
MAVQFHIAHSATVIGAGVLAGGPYYCAQGSVWTALYNCMEPTAWASLPAVSLLALDTDILARSGLIDPTANLKRARVWLFTGKRTRPWTQRWCRLWSAITGNMSRPGQ